MPLWAEIARPMPATWFMRSCEGAYAILMASLHPLAEFPPIFVKEIIFRAMPGVCIRLV
jgi:hypothetical protein